MRTWKVRSSDASCQLPLITGRAPHAARRPCSMLAPDLPASLEITTSSVADTVRGIYLDPFLPTTVFTSGETTQEVRFE